jgi:small subunit ribosomal protein S20
VATHKSSKKRARQAIKRRERNRQYMSKVRTAIKKFKTALASNEGVESLKTLLTSAQSNLAKAAKKGIIHSNNAQRHISRLALSLNKVGSAPSAVASKAPVKAAAAKKVAKKAVAVAAKKTTATAKRTSSIPAKKKSAKKSK